MPPRSLEPGPFDTDSCGDLHASDAASLDGRVQGLNSLRKFFLIYDHCIPWLTFSSTVLVPLLVNAEKTAHYYLVLRLQVRSLWPVQYFTFLKRQKCGKMRLSFPPAASG